jgi:hypothetical protein
MQLVVPPNAIACALAADTLPSAVRSQQNVEVVTAERMPMLAVSLVGILRRECHNPNPNGGEP